MVAVAIFWLGWAGEIRAWNARGHETVGLIADRLIAGSATAAQVDAILGTDLRTASVWADCVKGVSRQDGEFHYTISERYRECRPFEDAAGQARMVDYVRRNWDACQRTAGEEPCHKQYHYTDVATLRDRYARGEVGTSDHDIVAALGAAIALLQGRPVPVPFSIRDKKEALLMLAHFVGDLHQPLHVGAVYLDATGRPVDPDQGPFDPDTGNRGGNQLLDGERLLHTEWDDIPTGALDAKKMPPTAGVPSDWPAMWASDTLQVSRAAFQGVVFGAENPLHHTWPAILPIGYAERREVLQRRQLVTAGARLAELLQALTFDLPQQRFGDIDHHLERHLSVSLALRVDSQ
jgi:hypothetical protein